MPSRPTLSTFDPATSTFSDWKRAYDRDGAVIILDMLAPETLSRLRRELAEAVRGTDPGAKTDDTDITAFWGTNTKRFTRLAHRSRTFANKVLIHPLLLQFADATLLPSCAQYWMNTGQMMVIGPGNPEQAMHRDGENWGAVCKGPDSPEVTVSCMFAVTDFTEAAGATRVVPGSHLWPEADWRRGRVPLPSEVAVAEMPAGAGMIYSGKVVHAGGANTTRDEWRQGLHLSYVCGWLTPEEAGCLGLSEAEAQRLTEQQQRLLGWRAYDDSKINAVRLWTVDYEDVPVGLRWSASSRL
jgi:ectoine hydroxylase-related dioxygenase (phytanoyl-CoA dioxygenase family)